MLPRRIKYQGQIYRLAESQHKRCPRRQHWNDEQKRCLPLPAEIQQYITRARRASAKAKFKSRITKGSTGKLAVRLHRRAQEAHDKASGLHMKVVKAADKLGFNDLAQKHTDHMAYHDEKTLHHQDQRRKHRWGGASRRSDQ